MSRSDDWIEQSEKDFLHAKESLRIEHFEWSVLAAQQCAEKAIKALFFKIGADVWGHSILKFLKKLPDSFEIDDTLIKAAKYLDKHYITARYPNGFASGAPKDYYMKKDAQEAIKNAEKIFRFCKNQISSFRKETD